MKDLYSKQDLDALIKVFCQFDIENRNDRPHFRNASMDYGERDLRPVARKQSGAKAIPKFHDEQSNQPILARPDEK